MITRIVKMTLQDSKVDEYKSFLESVKDQICDFEGCEHLEILNDKVKKNIFFSYSIWKSEDHLENYRNSKLFKEIWATAKQYFAKETQAWTVDNVFDNIP